MNTFSALEIHILGHMFLSRRRSRGETDGHKVCQKGFREAMLHSVIPWYKLASISPPPQHFCDTAATWLAGVRDQLLSPSLFKTLPMWPVIDLIFSHLSANMKNEAAVAGSGFLACGGEQETGTKILEEPQGQDTLCPSWDMACHGHFLSYMSHHAWQAGSGEMEMDCVLVESSLDFFLT